MVQKALKELVLDGLVPPLEIDSGIVFHITADGKKYCTSLESDCAREYKTIAKKVVQFVSGKSERSIIAQINRLSATSFNEVAK